MEGISRKRQKTFWDCEYKLWTDKDNRELIEKNLHGFYRFMMDTKKIERADAIRYLFCTNMVGFISIWTIRSVKILR